MIEVILGIAILGVFTWIIVTYIPMPEALKSLIVILVVFYVVVKVVLPMFGIVPRMP